MPLPVSLDRHIWSLLSGNNCHAVQRSLSSSTSVYEVTIGFYLVPFCQPSPPMWFLLITAIGMCHFLPVHHFGMACLAGSKVNIQHNHGINKVFRSEFCVGSRVRHETPKQGWKMRQLKCCEYNNEDDNNRLKTLHDITMKMKTIIRLL